MRYRTGQQILAGDTAAIGDNIYTVRVVQDRFVLVSRPRDVQRVKPEELTFIQRRQIERD